MVAMPLVKRVRKWACALRWRPLFNTANSERWRARRETDNPVGERIRESDSGGIHLDLWHPGEQRRPDIEDLAFCYLCRDDEARRSRFDESGCVVELLLDTGQLSRESDRWGASRERCRRVVEGLRQADRLGIHDDARRPGDNLRCDLVDAAFHQLCYRRHARRASRHSCGGIVELLSKPDLLSARRQGRSPSREQRRRVEDRCGYFLIRARRDRGRARSEGRRDVVNDCGRSRARHVADDDVDEIAGRNRVEERLSVRCSY